MSNIVKNSKVDEFIEKQDKWQDEYKKFREIVLKSGLKEEIKWRVPVYTDNGKNILILHGFKEFIAINFVKGSLLKDPNNILVQQTENSLEARQIRVTSVKQIDEIETIIPEYIKEAILNEREGLKTEKKSVSEYEMPVELEDMLNNDLRFKEAFQALTPGRQKAYILHFSSAKQPNTRISRIEKAMPKIFDGVGPNEYSKK